MISFRKKSKEQLLMSNIIEEKIEEIINELGLTYTKDSERMLQNYLKVHSFIATNNIVDPKLNPQAQFEKEKILDYVYSALIKKESTSIGNSFEFMLIMNKLGADTLCVKLSPALGGKSHYASLANIDGEYYFFDPTLERDLYLKRAMVDDKFSLRFAALGKDFYGSVFIPKKIQTITQGELPLPENIAHLSLSKAFVNDEGHQYKKTR